MLLEKIALIKRTNGLKKVHSESSERKRFVEVFNHSTHKLKKGKKDVVSLEIVESSFIAHTNVGFTLCSRFHIV